MTVLISGGCIRLYKDDHETPGPQWHINSGHSTIGLIDTSAPPTIDASGFLVVNFLDVGPRSVVSMTAASDESLTARGIFAGCSGGGSNCRIRFYKNGINGADGVPLNLNNAVHWDRVSGDLCNLWITFVHEVDDLT